MDHAAASKALAANPGLPIDANGPVFRAPWEAQAFAMALTLHDKGVFEWSEWAAELGATIKEAQAAGDPDTGETYYRHWLATLERMIAKKAVTTQADLTSYRNAWERAAARTPHGQPIELQKADFTNGTLS
jgi:nitrile hydratase accessory protein